MENERERKTNVMNIIKRSENHAKESVRQSGKAQDDKTRGRRHLKPQVRRK